MNAGSMVFNIFINSEFFSRSSNEKSCDFSIVFHRDEIIINPNEEVNVNAVSFSLLNSMCNINEFTVKKVNLKMRNNRKISHRNIHNNPIRQL